MTRAVTIRRDDEKHAALAKQAEQLRVRPGTPARMLAHAGLSGNALEPCGDSARTALERLVRRSAQRAPADAARLVTDARVALHSLARHAADLG